MANIFASLRRKGGKKRKSIADPFPGVSLHIMSDKEGEDTMPFPGIRLHTRNADGQGGAASSSGGRAPVVADCGTVLLDCGYESVQGPVRPSMEDTMTCEERFRGENNELDAELAYFGVYDGHSGAEAAQLIQKRLHQVICGSSHCREGNIEQALLSGFLEMDQEVLRHGAEEGWRSGATVTVAIVRGLNLYTANVGDSLVVLARKGEGGQLQAEILAEVHKASVESEKARIKAAGGMVMRGRVYGDLAISRALGDSQYKRPTADGDFVSAIPATRRVALSPDNPFMVLATDGLWDKVSPDETVKLVQEKIAADGAISGMTIAKELTALTIERGSGDNVTIIVVRFQWDAADAGGASSCASTSSAS